MTEEDNKWREESTRILRSYLVRKNIKYHDLAKVLQSMGLNENANSIANKLSRGTFSFSFFLQCMYALRIDNIELNLEQHIGDK